MNSFGYKFISKNLNERRLFISNSKKDYLLRLVDLSFSICCLIDKIVDRDGGLIV